MHTRITLFFLSLATSFLLVGQTVFAQAPPVGFAPNLFEVAAYPGDEVPVQTTFRNGLDTPLIIHARVEDFIPQGEEGGVIVGPSVDDAHSLKAWVRVAPEEAVVPPHGTVELKLTVRVPQNAMPKSRWAALVVTTAFNQPDGTRAETQISGNILLRIRGEATETQENVSIESFTAPRRALASPATFEVRFRNTGTVHLKPRGSIEVRNLFGTPVARISLPERNVIPGFIRRVEAPLDEHLRFGPYTARMDATYGLAEKKVSAEMRFWIIPWKTIGPAFVVFTGLLLFTIWKRKARKAAGAV